MRVNQPPQGYSPYQPQQAPLQPGIPPQGQNPYAPPSQDAQSGAPAYGATGGGGQMWVEDGCLVVPRDGAQFPDRCVVCNKPTGYKLERKLQWHASWVYLLVLLSLWIYIIVALITRKKAHLHVGLCDEHRAKRKNAMLIGWLGSLAAMATCSGGIAMESDAGAGLIGLSSLAVLIFAIVGLVRAKTISAKKMDDTHAWLRVGPPFLQSIGAAQQGQPGVVQY